MQTKYIVRIVFGLMVLILGNGCVTKHLWESSEFENWNHPTANSDLRIYEAKSKNDLLVVYNEYSERHDSTRARAYWLNENQKLVENRHMPHFVSTNSAANLTAIPVYSSSANLVNLPQPFVITVTNGQSFTLYSKDRAHATYDLPFYNDQKGKVEKFALTPLATVADVTIVGGVIGYLYLEGMAGAGSFNPSY
jgi:hypothetical protein